MDTWNASGKSILPFYFSSDRLHRFNAAILYVITFSTGNYVVLLIKPLGPGLTSHYDCHP